MNISEQTKNFLRDSKWSQSRLAAAIGVNVVSLSRYLNHQKKKSTGELLAEFLMSQSITPATPATQRTREEVGDDAA